MNAVAPASESETPDVGFSPPRGLVTVGLVYVFFAPLDVIELPIGTPVTISGAIFLVVWAGYLLTGRVQLPKSPVVYLCLAGLVAWSAATLLWSWAPETTAIQTLTTLFLALSMVAIATVFRGRLVAPALTLAIACSLEGLAAIISGPEVDVTSAGVYIQGEQATFLGVDQNALAFHLTLGLAAALFVALRGAGRTLVIGGLLMSGLLSVSLIVVGSRTGVGTLIVTGFVFIALSARSLKGTIISVLGAGVILLSALALADSGLVPARVVSWLANPIVMDSRTQIIDAYQASQSVWMLKGVGAGAGADYLLAAASWYKEAHSAFWKTWVELGVLGLALWVVILTVLVVNASRSRDRDFFALCLPAIGFFFYTLGPMNSNVLWLIFGFALGAIPLARPDRALAPVERDRRRDTPGRSPVSLKATATGAHSLVAGQRNS